ncbi:MAG TPA: DUF1080 domain-containing protein [Opitutaceae bacterium]|nr:DUF1080 domain-containing protein [Opitutaceae bacterium]
MNLEFSAFEFLSASARQWRAVACLGFLLCAASTSHAATQWTDLLDKTLSKWDTYLSYQHKVGYDGSQPVGADGKPLEAIGYNKDATHVFSVEEIDGKLAVHVSGEFYGCIITKQEFENYRLKLKVKWGTKKWPPRLDKLRDGGVLYHSNGPCGVDYWRAWARSQEFQIMEGHMGDYWSIESSAIDIRAYLPEGTMNSVADATQSFLAFGAKPSVSGFCLRHENAESKPGEWTDVELVCFKGKSLHIINGHVVMVLKNSRYMKDGVAVPMTKGKIQLQSEAGELYYADVKIQEIDSLPQEYEALFVE